MFTIYVYVSCMLFEMVVLTDTIVQKSTGDENRKRHVYYDRYNWRRLNGCSRCHPMAYCTHGRCKCRHGYMGDGYDCQYCCRPNCCEPSCCHGTTRRPPTVWTPKTYKPQPPNDLPCHPNPCLNGGTCLLQTSGNPLFKCICPVGYKGNVCQEDICAECDVNAYCPRGRYCRCKHGYHGDGFICHKDMPMCIHVIQEHKFPPPPCPPCPSCPLPQPPPCPVAPPQCPVAPPPCPVAPPPCPAAPPPCSPPYPLPQTPPPPSQPCPVQPQPVPQTPCLYQPA